MQGGFFKKNSSPSKPVPQNSDTITPMPINWLNSITQDLKDDTIKMDSKILDKITICGFINSFKIDKNKFFLTLQDGFSEVELITIKKFDETTPLCLKNIDLEEKSYLKVVLNVFTSAYTKTGKNPEILFTAISFEKVDLKFFTFHIVNSLVARKVRLKGKVGDFEPREYNPNETKKLKENGGGNSGNERVVGVGEKIFILCQRIARGGGYFDVGMVHREFEKRISVAVIEGVFQELVENGKIYQDPGTCNYLLI